MAGFSHSEDRVHALRLELSATRRDVKTAERRAKNAADSIPEVWALLVKANEEVERLRGVCNGAAQAMEDSRLREAGNP